MTKKIAANNSRPTKKRPAFGEVRGESTTNQKPVPSVVIRSDARRWYLIGIFVLFAFGGTYLMQALKNREPNVPRFIPEIVREYPHDPTAFTQGLLLDDGYVWESTGKYDGQSSIRKVILETGQVVIQKQLPDDQFGEGLAMVGDKLYQLTWKEGICHVYDLNLEKISEFTYRGQGWGLTYDGKHLIMSDGSAKLYFIDPETFEKQRVITVRNGHSYISGLNELEYTNGHIYANRLDQDNVYEIDPATGRVVSIIELGSLLKDRPRENVLNGIAIDADTQQLIVTGKYWPTIFEIKLKPKP